MDNRASTTNEHRKISRHDMPRPMATATQAGNAKSYRLHQPMNKRSGSMRSNTEGSQDHKVEQQSQRMHSKYNNDDKRKHDCPTTAEAEA